MKDTSNNQEKKNLEKVCFSENIIACFACGAKLNNNINVCPYCGTKLDNKDIVPK